jgi:hypothetical protein
MSKWLLRGLVFAALMVFIRLVQGAAINAWETKAALISITLVVLFAIAVLIWGFFDGRSNARANPDPDRREDLAMTWLLAGLFAGIVSGAVAWLISMFYKSLYVGGLINELTTFAAFTALLTFVMAIAGVAVGHWTVDRRTDAEPRKRHGNAAEGDDERDDERADTDVFAAVRHPDSRDDAPADEEEAPTERRGQEQR